MADEIDTQPTPDQAVDVVEVAAPVTPGVVQPTPTIDEGVPGGAYMVGGQLVDSEGRPVKKGKR